MNWLDDATVLSGVFPEILIALFRTDEDLKMLRVKRVTSGCFLWSWNGLKLLADHPGRPGLDSVFPPHPESVFLARLLSPEGSGRKFLDVGIGTGILAIQAARSGWISAGCDINMRAIAVSRLNAIVNRVSVDIQEDSLGESFRGSDIDLCIANLPFEPTPLGCDNYTHSDGGLYGDRWTSRFLEMAPEILNSDGVAIIPSFSLISARGSRLEECMKRVASDSLEYAILRLSEPFDIRSLFGRYKRSQWKDSFKRLRSEGYENFAVELLLLKKVLKGKGRRLGNFTFRVADKSWIMPIGYRDVGRPGGGRG